MTSKRVLAVCLCQRETRGMCSRLLRPESLSLVSLCFEVLRSCLLLQALSLLHTTFKGSRLFSRHSQLAGHRHNLQHPWDLQAWTYWLPKNGKRRPARPRMGGVRPQRWARGPVKCWMRMMGTALQDLGERASLASSGSPGHTGWRHLLTQVHRYSALVSEAMQPHYLAYKSRLCLGHAYCAGQAFP